jgi:hypothetical protein
LTDEVLPGILTDEVLPGILTDEVLSGIGITFIRYAGITFIR